MQIDDDDYDRERLALYIAQQLPLNQSEADKVLALAGRIMPLVIESRKDPGPDLSDDEEK
jgi:hypothetical protein